MNNSVATNKTGKACAINILSIVAVGDSSIDAAKNNGAVRNVAFADTTYFSILGIFQRGCTVVRGE